MGEEQIASQSLSGGELSPNMEGRSQLPVYANGARRIKNFVVRAQGGGDYRTGFRVANHTRQHQFAHQIRFQFNNEQTYNLEFTNQKMRVYKDSGVVLDSARAHPIASLSGSTLTITGDVTADFAANDEVFIQGVGGKIDINDRFYIVALVGLSGGDTVLTVEDVDATSVSLTGLSFTASFATATVTPVYELDTPYREVNDLTKLQVNRDSNLMYVSHPDYEPRKLTRTDHDVWALDRYASDRIADPFEEKKTALSNFGTTVAEQFRIIAHGFTTGDRIYFEGVDQSAADEVGTLVNSLPTFATRHTDDQLSIQDADGVPIDLSSFVTNAAPGGYVAWRDALPTGMEFYESRNWYAGQVTDPQLLGASKIPFEVGHANQGDPRFDDYTLASGDEKGLRYTIADAEDNTILWLKGLDDVLIAGTFGSLLRITGTTIEAAITPSSVNARGVEKSGTQAVLPVNRDNVLFYVGRDDDAIYTLELDKLTTKFLPTDRTLVSDRITESGVVRLAWQSGKSKILWVVRNDGVLAGMTFQPTEEIAGWHRHTTGATGEDKFLDLESIGRPAAGDQLWAVTERTLGGNTRRFIEFQADELTAPSRIDTYTDSGSKAADDLLHRVKTAEVQKQMIHLDAAISYDGSAVSDRTITPGATTGNAVTFTAAGGTAEQLFNDAYVGRQIWKKPVNGVGSGRAVIVSVSDSEHATCRIIEDFDNTDTMAVGGFYLTKKNFYGYEDFKGATLSVVCDGGLHPDVTVSSTGSFDLDADAGVVHTGVKYEGLVAPMPLEFGAETGSTLGKLKHITKIGVRFLESLGAEVGTDLYNMQRVPFTSMPLMAGMPVPLFSGVKTITIDDTWSEDKNVFVRQVLPFPCRMQALIFYGDTSNN